MKIRHGHVSNSSTSSFIIAYRPDIHEIIINSKEFEPGEYDKFFGCPPSKPRTLNEIKESVKDKGINTQIDLMWNLFEDDEHFISGQSNIQTLKDLFEISEWTSFLEDEGIDLDAAALAIENGYVFCKGSLGYTNMASKGSEYLTIVGIDPPEGVLVLLQP